MPCLTQPNRTPEQKARQVSALQRLAAALASGSVSVSIGRAGGIAFVGWSDREGVSDLCA